MVSQTDLSGGHVRGSEGNLLRRASETPLLRRRSSRGSLPRDRCQSQLYSYRYILHIVTLTPVPIVYPISSQPVLPYISYFLHISPLTFLRVKEIGEHVPSVDEEQQWEERPGEEDEVQPHPPGPAFCGQVGSEDIRISGYQES